MADVMRVACSPYRELYIGTLWVGKNERPSLGCAAGQREVVFGMLIHVGFELWTPIIGLGHIFQIVIMPEPEVQNPALQDIITGYRRTREIAIGVTGPVPDGTREKLNRLGGYELDRPPPN